MSPSATLPMDGVPSTLTFFLFIVALFCTPCFCNVCSKGCDGQEMY